MSKTINLQPWLDYFEMLHKYEEQGFLELKPKEHEVYVTQPALHAMSEGDDPTVQMRDGSIEKTVHRLRIYAAFLAQQGDDYLKQNFAVHVVQPDAPHDLLYTILLCYVHPWWRPWWKHEHVEVISYGKS